MRDIILLTGPAGVGKTTIAKAIAELGGFYPLSFAHPMRAMLGAIGLSENYLMGDRKETPCNLLCGRTPRYALQRLGTEWGRDLIGKDFWTNIWLKNVFNVVGDVVADDCRFPNEIDAAKKAGNVTVIKLCRDGVTRISDHKSESCDDLNGMYVHNNLAPKIVAASIFRIVKLAPGAVSKPGITEEMVSRAIRVHKELAALGYNPDLIIREALKAAFQ